LQAVNEKVSIFAGQVEDYPNPKVGALYCLSLSAKRLNEQDDDNLHGVMFACSIAMQNAIEVFPHNMADKILMGEAMAILEPLMAQENEKPYMKDVDAIAVKNAEVLND
jgi:hypothetical protein